MWFYIAAAAFALASLASKPKQRALFLVASATCLCAGVMAGAQ